MGVGGAKFTSAGLTSTHYVPGVYSRRNIIGAGTGVSEGNLCIIGASTGGIPYKLGVVTDKSEAKEALKGGELLDGIVHAFTGSRTLIPQQVYYMRVGTATQASLNLKAGGADVIALKSLDYGAHTNSIKLSIKWDATVGYIATVSYKGEATSTPTILSPAIKIKCGGEITSATLTIGEAGLTLTPLTTSGDTVGEATTISFVECETLEELAAKLGELGYTTEVIDKSGAKSTTLDYVSLTITGETTLYSNTEALIQALRGLPYIGEVSLIGNRLVPTTEFVYFTGGSASGPIVEDYITALAALETEDIQIIATPSDDEAVHSLIAQHCIDMCTVEKKRERTFFVGCKKDYADGFIDRAIAKAKVLNTEFGSLIIDTATTVNALTGQVEEVSPSILACMLAGMESAQATGECLTNKVLNTTGFGYKYRTSEYNKLIQGGIVTFGANDSGELVCIRAITCYQGNSLVQNERSMIRNVLYMDRDLRSAFAPRIGGTKAPNESEILQVLHTKAMQWYASDLITNGGDGNTFNEKVSFDGDKIYILFDRYIRAPTNFIFFTGTNRVWSSTIEL